MQITARRDSDASRLEEMHLCVSLSLFLARTHARVQLFPSGSLPFPLSFVWLARCNETRIAGVIATFGRIERYIARMVYTVVDIDNGERYGRGIKYSRKFLCEHPHVL